MPTFLYRAVDLDSQGLVDGSIDAVDSKEARSALRTRGILPLTLGEVPTETQAESRWLQSLIDILTFRPVKPNDLVLFTQQLATLIESGIPLVEVMGLLEGQTSHPTLKSAISQIRQDMLAGVMFSEALGKHPRVFSPLFRNMANAGEISGSLDILLGRLSEMLDKNLEIERKVKSALTYPVVVLVVLFSVVTLLMIVVVPTFEQMYGKAGQGLPLPTKILLWMSHTLRFSGGWVAAILLGTGYSMRWFSQTNVGKPIFARITLGIPLIGPLVLEQEANTFSRALGTVYGAGVPILSAIENCRKVMRNWVMADLVEKAEQGVRQGSSLAAGLQDSRYFPKILAQMIFIGESSGKLEELMAKAVSFSDKDVDYKIKQMTTMMEPMLTVLIGLIVMFIALALYLPMFDLPRLMMKG